MNDSSVERTQIVFIIPAVLKLEIGIHIHSEQSVGDVWFVMRAMTAANGRSSWLRSHGPCFELTAHRTDRHLF